MAAVNGLPAVQDMFSLDAILLASLFIVFSMPDAYKITGKFSEGMIQMFIHGLLLFYFFFFFTQFLPTSKWGLNRTPKELTTSGQGNMGL